MYIEFQLPDVIHDKHQAMAISIYQIDSEIVKWAEQHQISYYKTKRHKFTYRLILQNDEAYSYFALTWNPKFYVSKQFIFKQPK
jgi:hypothetical protein